MFYTTDSSWKNALSIYRRKYFPNCVDIIRQNKHCQYVRDSINIEIIINLQNYSSDFNLGNCNNSSCNQELYKTNIEIL